MTKENPFIAQKDFVSDHDSSLSKYGITIDTTNHFTFEHSLIFKIFKDNNKTLKNEVTLC